MPLYRLRKRTATSATFIQLVIPHLLTVCGILAACNVLAGCSSSETTSQQSTADEAKLPADSVVAIPLKVIPQKETRSPRRTPSGKQQGFVTQEDTIEAQVVTRGQGADHSKAPPRQSKKKKYYSVQIGAFRILANAGRAQKLCKQRFKKPIYHFYDKAIKMYRVTAGHFTKIKDAFGFLKTVQEQHPKDYKDAWVAEMRR